jgi:enoyl-CoA hydratase/carnithine racemase
MAVVKLEILDSIAIVSLDHPVGNRINFAMRDELLKAFQRVAESSARVLLLRSEGADFCLGGDVRDWPGMPSGELRPKIEVFAKALDQLESLVIPTVAVVQGRCFGGGFELILGCDLVIAGNSAKFACPEALLGIVTLQGGVFQLAQRIGRTRAIEFAFLSDAFGAEEAARLNLLNRVVPDEQLQDVARVLVERLESGPSEAYARTKTLLRAWSTGGISAAKAILYDVSMPLFDTEDVQVAIRGATVAAEQGLACPRVRFGNSISATQSS